MLYEVITNVKFDMGSEIFCCTDVWFGPESGHIGSGPLIFIDPVYFGISEKVFGVGDILRWFDL